MVKWDYLCACVCACVLSWPFKHIIPSLEFSIAVLKKFPRLLRNDWMEFLKQLFSFSFPFFFFCCCDCKKAAGLHSFSMLVFHLPLYSFMPCSCSHNLCTSCLTFSILLSMIFFSSFSFPIFLSAIMVTAVKVNHFKALLSSCKISRHVFFLLPCFDFDRNLLQPWKRSNLTSPVCVYVCDRRPQTYTNTHICRSFQVVLWCLCAAKRQQAAGKLPVWKEEARVDFVLLGNQSSFITSETTGKSCSMRL